MEALSSAAIAGIVSFCVFLVAAYYIRRNDSKKRMLYGIMGFLALVSLFVALETGIVALLGKKVAATILPLIPVVFIATGLLMSVSSKKSAANDNKDGTGVWSDIISETIFVCLIFTFLSIPTIVLLFLFQFVPPKTQSDVAFCLAIDAFVTFLIASGLGIFPG